MEQNFDKIERRLHALLQNEVLDRGCVVVTAPKKSWRPAEAETVDESWYMDGERVLARNLRRIDNTYYAGDALPYVFPYFGTGGHAKYFYDKIPMTYAPRTIWIDSCLNACDELQPADVQNSFHFKRELAVMEYLAAESRGRYYVSMPDNCGSYDALAQLRGNEEIMMDFYDDPDGLRRAGRLVVDCLRDSAIPMFEAVKGSCHGGSINGWMNIWSPGRVLQLQCDLSVMISPDLYREYILEELERTMDFLDHAIYHFDGIEQLRHLDLILSLPRLNMIQWTQVEGQPPVTEFIPALQKIQAAGKGILIFASKAQVKPLVENLSSKGLILNVTDAANPEEAEDIVSFVAKNTHE